MVASDLRRVSLTAQLRGIHDLPVARAFLADRFDALDTPSFAENLEPVIEGARRGSDAERSSMVAVASFIAHVLAKGDGARLAAVGEAAATVGCDLTHAVLAGERERVLAPSGRLADVGIGLYAWFWPTPLRPFEGQTPEEFRAWRLWRARPEVARVFDRPAVLKAPQHHDPGLIGRFLDDRRARARDVVAIAARRPTVPAMSLAVATRDRWLCVREVRVALAENPFTPAPLARALRVLHPWHSRSLRTLATDEMR